MKQFLLVSLLLSFVISCTQQGNKAIRCGVIDIEKNMQQLTELKTSDFGKTIRYIPLETTDDCLIGNAPNFKALKNYIIAETEKQCLLFSKKDGRFIDQIGHTGQDPAAFSEAFCWVDAREEFIFFIRGNNQLIRYDIQGTFRGKTEFASPPGLPSHFLLNDTEIIGYYNGFGQSVHYQVGFFDRDGVLIDTIPSIITKPSMSYDNVQSIQVNKGNSLYGNWGRIGAIIINFKDDTKQIVPFHVPRLWRNNENIRFKEDFIDTIYTIADRTLIPFLAFNTGKYGWPVEEITSKRNTNGRIFIGDIAENDEYVFFQCIKGMYSEEPALYNGLYNKKTGDTKMSENSIQDDLTCFMPFVPLSISTSGEFVSCLEAFAILEWLEAHPEAKNNPRLPFLKNLTDEMNPVIVLVE